MRSARFTRVVPDTGVLIESYRRGGVEELIRGGWLMCMSAVVLSELFRGVKGRAERRYVEGLARLTPVLTPGPALWQRCGRILGLVRRDCDYDERGLRDLQNDFLIALSARELGLPIVTTNVRDFNLLASYVRGVEVIEFPQTS